MESNRTRPHSFMLRSSVTPDGRFAVGIHRPSYRIANLRRSKPIASLGQGPDGRTVKNDQNFPSGDIDVPAAVPIFEIANPLPWRGVTYISKDWADNCAQAPERISLPPRSPVSMRGWLHEISDGRLTDENRAGEMLARLPDAVKLALATTSTDPRD
nr:hypothetical protein [Desulfobacterales bacterium]